ncbi:hypothetical protein D4764_14G0003190 [Takifugu flavidus]|uniref:Uncharacterized protein n=1 Tax=Takifugu flavidus TaxID=433684 RepID=A0A5C6P621_9TELE|nr:hypothetical protein D4764_14G0003190 [Takifugu flavidus]
MAQILPIRFQEHLQKVSQNHQRDMPVVDLDWVQKHSSFKRLTLCALCDESHVTTSVTCWWRRQNWAGLLFQSC